MDYEELIEDEDGPAKGSPDDELEIDFAEPRAKSPWKAFILTGLVASLFGAAGGGYGVYAGLKTQSPTKVEAPKIDLSPVETKIDRLTARIAAAEASASKAANQPAPKAEPVDFSALEARLDKLESAPKPEIDPAALSALQSAQKDGFEWPDTSNLEDRLLELETKGAAAPEASFPTDIVERLEALETATVEGGSSAIDDDRVETLLARLAALENRSVTAAQVERVSILAFPKDAMLAAVEENIEGGLLKRTLSRHVRVKDEDDPISLIEGIEVDIATGRFEEAANKFDRLPEPVRIEGQAWYDSVKASL